jgi:hypothetical protein
MHPNSTAGTAITLFAILLIPWRVVAAFDPFAVGPRPAALGGAAVALQGDPHGLFLNPSLIATATALKGSVAFVPLVFGMAELSRASCVLAVPVGPLALGVSGSHFGFSLYREWTVSLIAGFQPQTNTSVGIRVNWHTLTIAGYGCGSTASLDAGLRVQIGDDLAYAASILNATGASIGAARESLPQTLLTGFSFSPVSAILLVLDLTKDLDFPLSSRIGVEYQPLTELSLRCGMNGETGSFAAGLGLHVGQISFDYAISIHPVLGPTHHLAVTMGG